MKNLKIPSNIAISDSGFIFHPSNGETFTVNTIGGEIIKLLKEDKSFEEICNHITVEYDVDDQTINKDLSDYLNQLKNLNILKEI